MKRRLYGRPVSKLFDDKLPNDFFDCDDPEDLFTEGVELINGFDEDKNSVLQDIDKGIALITMAAEQGYAKAQTVLGLCYKETDKPCPTFSANGSLNIYRSDGKQAVYWLTKAADMGEITAIDEVIYLIATTALESVKIQTLLHEVHGEKVFQTGFSASYIKTEMHITAVWLMIYIRVSVFIFTLTDVYPPEYIKMTKT